MLLSLFLVTLLADAPQAQPAPPPPFEAAVQMADAGNDADALAAFQRIAAANPNDHQARLWIARLHERMGHPDLAQPVYRSIVLEDPANVDALLGSGITLLQLDQVDDSIETLERAQMLAPDNAAVLSALARAHAVAGHTRTAADRAERAADLDPTTVNRVAAERAAIADRNRVDLRYSREQFSDDLPDSNFGDVAVNLRGSDAVRVFGRAQAQEKFDSSEWRAGGGLAWTWHGAYTVLAQALVGPDDNLVMPERDLLGDFAYTYHQATGSIGVRYFDFSGLTMTVVSPAANWWATDRLWLSARYALSVTDSPLASKKEFGHTVQLRGSYQVWPRLTIDLGAARGVEDFDNLSLDRVGKFVATTGSAGVRIQFSTLTWVTGRYEYQRWHAGLNMGRATIALTQGF